MKSKVLFVLSILLGCGIVALAVVATKSSKVSKIAEAVTNSIPVKPAELKSASQMAAEDLYVIVLSTHNPYDLQAIEVEAAKERAKTDTTVSTNYQFVTAVSAVTGGIIRPYENDRATQLARGVCWSIDELPTIDDSYTVNGSGLGSFYSVITGLNPNTTYNVRSYVKYNIFNRINYSYGPQVTFTTSNWMPPFSCLHMTIEKATPSVVEMIYNYNNVNTKGFNVKGFQAKVNATNVKIKSMKIVNNVMYLTLSKSITATDVVTIKYTKTLSGGETNPFIGWTEVFNNIL